jgi:hypothetical protein
MKFKFHQYYLGRRFASVENIDLDQLTSLVFDEIPAMTQDPARSFKVERQV